MAEIKLFSIAPEITELSATSVTLEKDLQTLIEKNMYTFFGTTFLKSEFTIRNGRIDSLGLDENNCPVIFEYKRSMNENVINQGLFYLDWLLDHKADFKLLVIEKLGEEKANCIDWSFPCVICIASDFNKFDEHAVNQMQRNIKLVKYKKYGDDLVLFEHLNTPAVKAITTANDSTTTNIDTRTFENQYIAATEDIKNLYQNVRSYILSLGDDITENQLKLYVAFKKVKNFICAEMQINKIVLDVKLNPDTIDLIPDLMRNVRNIGHYGSGDLQIYIKSNADFQKIKPSIDRAYNEN